MKTLIVLFFIAIAVSSAQEIRHPSSVIGAGGETMTNPTTILRGTVSQFAIDYHIAEQTIHGVGFWYQPALLNRTRGNNAVIMIANAAASAGDIVEIPLILVSSKNLFQFGAKQFEAKIRFNKTLLEPLNALQVQEEQEDYIATFRGEAKDTAGILSMMRFRARLGNDSITPLRFTSFQWVETTKIKSTTEDGEFLLNDLCREGGKTRLVLLRSKLSATITPNPVHTQATIRLTLREDSHVRLVLSNVIGKEIRTINDAHFKSGEYQTSFDTELLPSGKYYIVLHTERDVVYEPFMISH